MPRVEWETSTGPPFQTDGRALGSPRGICAASVPWDPVETPSSGPSSSGSQQYVMSVVRSRNTHKCPNKLGMVNRAFHREGPQCC